jgi:hypothetical protein
MKRFLNKGQPSPISSMMQSLKELPALQPDRLVSALGKTLAEIQANLEKGQGVQIHLKDLLQLPDWLWFRGKEALEIAGFEMDNDLNKILFRRYSQVRLYQVRLNLENHEKKISESFFVQIKRFLIFIVTLTPLYFVLEVLIGRSIGKLLTGMVIVRQTKFQDYEEAKFLNLFVRWLI